MNKRRKPDEWQVTVKTESGHRTFYFWDRQSAVELAKKHNVKCVKCKD